VKQEGPRVFIPVSADREGTLSLSALSQVHRTRSSAT